MLDVRGFPCLINRMNASRFFLLLFLIAGTLRAQTPTPAPVPDMTRFPMWKCELPGGTYEVALRSIVSVSTHEYLVDNVARVTEVNIDTIGSMVVRFYYLEPNTPTSPLGIGQSTINKLQEMANEAATRTGQEEVWKKVLKNYPTTTHAHTIEYRVDTKESLMKLFKSAEEAWRLTKNTTLKL